VAIRVVPGAADLACDLAGRFLLQVTGSSDADAALGALAKARDEIAAMASASAPRAPKPVLSQAVLGPQGPLLLVARLEVGNDLLETVPELVATSLREAGVRTAVVEVLEPAGPLDRLDVTANAVLLRLFPSPAGADGEIPPHWIDVAADWVLGDLASTATVPLRLLGAPFDVVAADAPATLHQARVAHTWCDVVSGDLTDRLRTASVTFGRLPHLTLAAGGPACDTKALVARFDLLCEVARQLDDGVAYACVDFEPTFEGIGAGLPTDGWQENGGAPANVVAGEVGDVRVPDAFPYQIIGPGHVARLDGRATKPANPSTKPVRNDGFGRRVGSVGAAPIGEPLPLGRLEVQIGEPTDWLPIFDARHEVLELGWKLLADLLATDADVAALRRGRKGRRTREAEGEREGTAQMGGPNLDEVTLEAVPHRRRGLRLTLLELVAWQAHEAHSDDPRTVSPVLASFARWFAASLDPDLHQELKPRARRLIGTRSRSLTGGVGRRLPLDDDTRVWMAADWLARVQAPAWLRLAGHAKAAAGLEKIRPTRDHRHLDRAASQLSAAIEAVARGAEGDVPPGADALAWAVWERVAETAGWVAASEAASVGVPELLAYATELPVIECAREADARADLRPAKTTIERVARAAAARAAGEDAWSVGWRAASATIDERSLVPQVTAFERATRAASTRLGLEVDAAEVAIEAGEAAARAALADAIQDADPPASPWDAARDAAAESSGGATWAAVQDMTRDAVGADPWEAGMTTARTTVGRVLQVAPALVDRAVVVALAREAAGLAARSAAGRAAAAALAGGASSDEATDAAREALAPTAASLRDEAFVLFDALIEARSNR